MYISIDLTPGVWGLWSGFLYLQICRNLRGNRHAANVWETIANPSYVGKELTGLGERQGELSPSCRLFWPRAAKNLPRSAKSQSKHTPPAGTRQPQPTKSPEGDPSQDHGGGGGLPQGIFNPPPPPGCEACRTRIRLRQFQAQMP